MTRCLVSKPMAALCLSVAALGCSGLLGLDEFTGGGAGGAATGTGGVGGSATGTAGTGGSATGAGGAGGTATGVAGAGGEAGELLVFITGDVPRYDGDLGGLVGADEICQQRADSGSQTYAVGVWRAWLATTGNPAVDRIAGQGPWYLTSGALAFQSRTHLLGGAAPENPIVFDENGDELLTEAATWTGTFATGQPAMSHCNAWTSALVDDWGVVGLGTASGSEWKNTGVARCDFQLHLYCFQQP